MPSDSYQHFKCTFNCFLKLLRPEISDIKMDVIPVFYSRVLKTILHEFSIQFWDLQILQFFVAFGECAGLESDSSP